MQSLSPRKIGDTFSFTYRLPLSFGATIGEVQSQIRDTSGFLVETLTVTQLANDAEYANWYIEASAEQTSLWNVGDYFCDVKNVTTDGKVIRTDTFGVPIARWITQL